MRFDFTAYRHLTHFIAACMGEYTEVVLYSFEDINQSVIEIARPGISGIQLGDPLSGFAVTAMKDKGKEGPPYYLDHSYPTADGRTLKANSFLILDRQQLPMGMLTAYTDVAMYHHIAGIFQRMAGSIANGGRDLAAERGAATVPMQDLTPTAVIQQAVDEVTGGNPAALSRLTTKEKIAIVARLNQDGFFLIKGAVSQVAKVIGASEATVYRYLSNLTKPMA